MAVRIDVRLIDREVMKDLTARSDDQRVHIICRKLAADLQCSEITVYRAVKRLQSAGYIKRLDGSRKTGYTYRICA